MLRREGFRDAIRVIRTSPRFVASVSLTLAIGIGLTSTMFGVIDRLILRSVARVEAPQTLRRAYASLSQGASGKSATGVFGYATYRAIANGTHAIDGAAAYAKSTALIGSGADAREIDGAAVTASFFPLLGAKPAVGRIFDPTDDDVRRPNNVAVLSYEMWQREYGSSESALGQALRIQDKLFTIIGVMPKGFTGVELRPVGFWIPMSSSQEPTSTWSTTWRQRWLSVVVRIKAGLETQAAREMTGALHNAQPTGLRLWNESDISLRPLGTDDAGNRPAVYNVIEWLTAIAVIVLVIACVNIINLLLARAISRRREIAVRLALGMTRGRLVQLLLSESLVLAAIGGGAGVLLAYGGGTFLRARFLSDVSWESPPVGLRVFAVVVGLAALAGVVTGIIPALYARRTDVMVVLRAASPTSTGTVGRFRSGLLVAELALASILLVAAGLFMRSLMHARDIDLGFDRRRVLAVSIGWPSSLDSPGLRANWSRVRDAVASAPMYDAALASGSPFGDYWNFGLKVPGHDSLPTIGGPWIAAVSPSYFNTVGIALVRGRLFEANEGSSSEPVTIVNEAMAYALWPNEEPLGKCLLIGRGKDVPCSRVVGVVRGTRRAALREKPEMQYYVPLGQEHFPFDVSLELLVRPRGNGVPQARSIDRLRRMIARTEPTARLVNVRPLEDRLDPLIRQWQLGAELLAVFGMIVLVVAGMGLYSVVSYVTSQRMSEFGIRVALGARPADVFALVVGGTVRIAVVGIGIGIAVSLVVSERFGNLLFEEPPRDPVVIATVAAVLVIIAIVASAMPATTASRSDPVEALRAE